MLKDGIDLVAIAERHRELDMLAQGFGYGEVDETGKFGGCSVGCMLYDLAPEAGVYGNHKRLSEITGVPEWLLHLQDWCFENCTNYRDIHVNFAKGCQAFKGDTDRLHHRMQARIQREVVANPTELNELAAKLHDRAAEGQVVKDVEWQDARSAADSTARSVEWSAADSAAVRSVEWSAARSAEWSTEWSAEWPDASYAARSAAIYAVRYAERGAAADKVATIVTEELERGDENA